MVRGVDFSPRGEHGPVGPGEVSDKAEERSLARGAVVTVVSTWSQETRPRPQRCK